ncbi:Uncharacterized protein Rs2_41244 [Raphanus sativus]|nr:Uncharacterized protein Rs2_41244 [Raphanus sativus]
MTYRLPEWMLVPDGNKTPPITIQETPDVEVMMAVRAWFADLTLSVTIGAEDVARYQFFCRTDFNIGSSSYKFENGTEDPSFEGFLGETVVASQNTLEKYFDEQEMMVIHRVHLEMEKAKLDLENQQCYDLIHGNEIIIINDTDSDGDGAEPLGQNTLSVTVFNTGVALESEYISEPNMSNDLPMEFYEGIPIDFTVDADNVFVQPSSPVMQDNIQFWEGFIGAENHNGVKDEDHSEAMEVDIELSQIIPELQQTGNSSVQDANSSTDSAPDLDNINNVVLGCENVSENLSNTQPIYDNPLVSEDVLDATDVIASAEIMPQDSASVDLIPSANNSPAISMNVGLIPNPALEVDNLVINLDDYSSEDSMDSGVF